MADSPQPSPTSDQDERWAQWDQFVAAHPHGGFMQCAAWIRCRAKDDYDHFALMLRDEGGQLVGGAIVGRWEYGENHAFYYIQEGPLLPDDPELSDAVLNAVMASLEEHRKNDTEIVSHLRIEPRCAGKDAFTLSGFQPPSHSDRFREPRHTHCVDLQRSEELRLQSMKPKGRYNVNVARRHGVTVVQDNTERGLDEFLAIRDDTAHRQNLKRRSRRYFTQLQSEFGAGAHIFFAELDGQRLASAFVLRFGDRATYIFGGSLTDRRDVMAPYLLHHEIMTQMTAQGCASYDFWGTAPPDQPNHDWAGITTFKRKFGGTDVAHMPTLDLVYDRDAYDYFNETEATPVDSVS